MFLKPLAANWWPLTWFESPHMHHVLTTSLTILKTVRYKLVTNRILKSSFTINRNSSRYKNNHNNSLINIAKNKVHWNLLPISCNFFWFFYFLSFLSFRCLATNLVKFYFLFLIIFLSYARTFLHFSFLFHNFLHLFSLFLLLFLLLFRFSVYLFLSWMIFFFTLILLNVFLLFLRRILFVAIIYLFLHILSIFSLSYTLSFIYSHQQSAMLYASVPPYKCVYYWLLYRTIARRKTSIVSLHDFLRHSLVLRSLLCVTQSNTLGDRCTRNLNNSTHLTLRLVANRGMTHIIRQITIRLLRLIKKIYIYSGIE